MSNKELQNILHFYATRKRHIKLNDCLKNGTHTLEPPSNSYPWDLDYEGQINALNFANQCIEKFYPIHLGPIPNYFERMVENLFEDRQFSYINERFRPIGEFLCMIEKFYKGLNKYHYETSPIYEVLKLYVGELIRLHNSLPLNRLLAAIDLSKKILDELYRKINNEEF